MIRGTEMRNRQGITGNVHSQGGAALVIGLLLLVVITILAVSGMNTAATELAMARNDQNYEYAFQAAETGLEYALSQGSFSTQADGTPFTQEISARDSVQASIQYENATIVPDQAFSLGEGVGVAAYHFVATARATSLRLPGGTTDRDSTAEHSQAFYVVGPAASSL
jgi:type IV pilus assembly protein PilX